MHRKLLQPLAVAVSLALSAGSALAASSFDVTELDKAISPCGDFNGFVNAKWVAKNPIPGDRTRWGAFDQLREHSLETQHDIAEKAAKGADAAKAGSVEQKIGWFYRSGMSEAAVEKAGYDPVKADLAKIDALKSPADIVAWLTESASRGRADVFQVAVLPDFKNAATQIAYTFQAGLGLPTKDYYEKADYAELREAYKAHVESYTLEYAEKTTGVPAALIAEAALRGDHSVVYAYERELDHCGHVHGCSSATWLEQLARIDAMCERLRAALPPQVTLIITADHGMIDIPPQQRIVAEDDPALMAGVSALAGEGRFRQLYVDHDLPQRVADRWRARLGELAWVRTRDEAIDEGWFAAIDDQLRDRWGHVLVALRGDWAVMTRAFPREFTLIGMHGSLTAAEMLVPLIVA